MKELEKLEGVGEKTAQKLIEAGYDTIEKIANAKIEDLKEKLKINESVANTIIESSKNENEDGKITLENFKIKKGIPDYIYKGFKINLKAKDNSKYDLKDLEKKYKDFLNKKI